jgi:hypothetical protein
VPASSEDLVVPEASAPEFAASEDGGGEEEDVKEAAAEDANPEETNEDADRAEDAESEVVAAEVMFAVEDGNPWLDVCVVIDELYPIVVELYDWLEETYVETVTEVVTVTVLVVAEQAMEEVREMCCLRVWVLHSKLALPWS